MRRDTINNSELEKSCQTRTSGELSEQGLEQEKGY